MNDITPSICSVCGCYIIDIYDKVLSEGLPKQHNRVKYAHRECRDNILEEVNNTPLHHGTFVV